MTATDVLGEICDVLRLHGETYFTARLAGPYGVTIPPEGQRIRFHLVLDGHCYLQTRPDRTPQKLSAGDLVLVPNGAAHILADDPDRVPMPLSEVLQAYPMGADQILRVGAGDRPSEILCGFCGFDEAMRHPMFVGMPDHLVVHPDDPGCPEILSGLVKLLAVEARTRQAGMTAVITRLIEIVVIETLRAQIANGSDVVDKGKAMEGAGEIPFLAALSDPGISRVLSAMHHHPDFAWTADLLAREAGMSRTRFSVRFSKMAGCAPIEYLMRWRMILAADLLRQKAVPVDEIGRRCGYESLPSFTRRFKAHFGVGPGTYRRSWR